MYTERMAVLLVSAFLAACATTVASPPDTDIDCRRGSEGMVVPQFMPRAMRERARVIDYRAERLTVAFLATEALLREAGYEPDDFEGEGRSWAAITRGDNTLIAIYVREEGQLVRAEAFGVGNLTGPTALLQNAEQALAHVPTECGEAFGVLDIGLMESDAELLHVLRLVDRKERIAWGMHYRFLRVDGTLSRVERLHIICETYPAMPSELADDAFDKLPPRFRRAMEARIARGESIFGARILLPELELPTEAHMMQLRLYPDPYWRSARFWGREGIVDIPHGSFTIPDKFSRARNPCTVVERTEG